MLCKKCKVKLGTGETSIEYCDGFCFNCYDDDDDEKNAVII